MVSNADKRIALFGLLGVGNFGNDGSLEAVIQSLGRIAPTSPLLCICSNPELIGPRYGLKSIVISHDPVERGSRWQVMRKIAPKLALPVRLVWHLRRVKALIVPGMGVLDDFTVSPVGWPLDLFLWLTTARLMGVKVAMVSIGAGPIESPLSRLLMKGAARAAHFRSFRDANSRDFVAGLGIDVSDDPIVPDVAFGLAQPMGLRAGGDLTVGVGLMTYQGWHETEESPEIYRHYLSKMSRFVEWILGKGMRVRLVGGSKSDEQAIHDLLESLRADAALSVDYDPANDLGDVLKQLAGVDITVATRYHNVVGSLTLGRPTISIGYSQKNEALLRQVGLEGFDQHIETLDVELLKRQFDRLLAERAELEQRIRGAVADFQLSLREQEKRLARFLST